MDYTNGKIYTIRSNQTEKFYIGSTCMPLSKRMYVHRQHKAEYEKSQEKYTSSFDILQFGDAYIELLENFPCKTKEELVRREGELIRQYKDQLVNKIIAGRTRKERDTDNKDIIKAYKGKYNEEHKEEIKEYKHNYKMEHKDEVKDYNSLYREANKERLAERVMCEKCGIEVRRTNISYHNKTKSHLKNI